MKTRVHSLSASPLAALALALSVSLTACASSDATQSDGASTGAGPGDGGGFPGTFGKVAAVSDGVAQVQGNDSQTAVTFTDAAITSTEAATLADVVVSQCVTVSFASDAAEAASPADIPATSVSISVPVDGQCSPFGGGMRGAGGPGGPGDTAERPEPPERPDGARASAAGDEGARGDRPAGRPGGDRVSGKVTAVSASGFTVDAITLAMRSPEEVDGDAPEPSTESREVAVDGGTGYTRQVSGDVEDVSVGRCVTAAGENDATGGLTAATVTVTDAVDGECSVGGGRR